MGAFKFDTFVPPTPAQDRRRNVDFATFERERDASYASGFKDGVKVTSDALLCEQNRLLSEITELVSDTALTRDQAAAALTKSFLPLVRSALSSLTPELLGERLIELLTLKVGDILSTSDTLEVRVEVNSSAARSVSDIFEAKNMSVKVVGNDDLSAGEANINWADGIDHIALSDLRTRVIEEVESFGSHLEEDGNERTREFG